MLHPDNSVVTTGRFYRHSAARPKAITAIACNSGGVRCQDGRPIHTAAEMAIARATMVTVTRRMIVGGRDVKQPGDSSAILARSNSPLECFTTAFLKSETI
jgi:hypothetical protein